MFIRPSLLVTLAASMLTMAGAVWAGPVTYSWVGECAAAPQDWACGECFDGNWSPAGEPGPADTVDFPGGSDVTSRGCTKSVSFLTAGAGSTFTNETDLAIGVSATFQNAYIGWVGFATAISTPGTVRFDGIAHWRSGVLTGGGDFIFDHVGNSTSSSVFKSLDGATLVNNGTFAGTGFDVRNGASILNYGTFQLASGNLGNPAQVGFLFNHATFEKTQTTTATTVLPFNNLGGTIRAQAGTLSIGAGGDHQGGQYELAGDATLALLGFEVGGIPNGVKISGPVEASGQGSLKIVQAETVVMPFGSLETTVAGSRASHGFWLDDDAVLVCDGPVVNRGDMRWSRGRITGATGLTHQSGILRIGSIGFGCCQRELAATLLTSNALVEQSEDIRMLGGATIINCGTWMNLGGSILDFGGENLFRNCSVLRRDGVLPTTLTGVGVPFEQTISGGTFADRGIFVLVAGGTIQGGVLEADTDGEVRFDGGHYDFGAGGDDPSSGSVLMQGEGEIRIRGASTTCFADEGFTVTAAMPPSLDERGFELDNGFLGGPGVWRNTGEMNWTGGTIGVDTDGVWEADVRNAGTLGIPSSGARTLRGQLTNESGGIVTFGNATIDGGTLTNDGLLITFSGFVQGLNGGAVVNRGALEKFGNSSTSFSTTFDNPGRVTVFDGALHLLNGAEQLNAAGCLEGGRWEVAGDATLDLHATVTKLVAPTRVRLADAASFPSIADLVENAGTIDVEGGSFLFPQLGENTGRVTMHGGVLETGATFSSVGGIVEQRTPISGPLGLEPGLVTPEFLNAGTIRPGGAEAPGPFNVTGNLVQSVGGRMEIELAGEVPVTAHDQIRVTGDVTLGGTLSVRVLPGYAPRRGAMFTVLEALDGGSISGAFDVVSGAGEWKVTSTATTVQLTVITPPLPGDIDGDGGVGFGDLLLVLAAWGVCEAEEPCVSDLDGDGVVGFGDLLLLLANWTS